MKSTLRRLLFTISLLALISSCASNYRIDEQTWNEAPAAGGPISIERVGSNSLLYSRLMVWLAGLSDRVKTSYGVDLYRVEYFTQGEDGELVPASGLLTLPRTEELKGILSWQHGTTVTREQVPSLPTLDEGVLASIAFAGHGYVLLAPDYIGLGQSELNHPYYHRESSVNSIRNLIHAARVILERRGVPVPDSLYLVGFSQGGYNTVATMASLESNPLPNLNLVAGASIAGAFDLGGFSFVNAMEGESQNASLYIAYIVNTYSRVYNYPLDSIFRSPYAETVPSIFSGSLQGQEVVEALPRSPRELFTEDYLNSFDAGDLGWLGMRLSENSNKDWQPHRPLRLYYGNEDIDVSPQDALDQVNRWREQGINIDAIDVGPFNHDVLM